eukprot:CAMPEP_0178593910 /NCGR_PEP_ID=MMETSP0697-20121206/30208_1 /TAXON_ID=265572 /ORGANISM="Extubocellulus spinifer, Strain CCMP396" /LENGTH=591 /DNA_ID=CAMNT_0020231137 /DNA_START=50 /DNA_END=1820 /DNA_ORIENTATION=-
MAPLISAYWGLPPLYLAPSTLDITPQPLAAAFAQDLSVDQEFKDFDDRIVLEYDGLVDIAFSPSEDFLLLLDKQGKVFVMRDYQSDGDESPPAQATSTTINTTLALDISYRICSNGERGLLAVAIHPDYPTKPYIYLYYTHLQDDCYSGSYREHGRTDRGTFNRLSRFVLSPDTLTIDESSEEMFLETMVSPVHNHCGGDVDFGNDGLLYAIIGDLGGREYKNDDGQFLGMALDNLAGKIVRLTEDGNIPDDNPYSPANGYGSSVRCGRNRGRSGNAAVPCQEVFATGLRNPFRFAFDPNTGPDETRFWVNVVGWKNWEWIVEGRRAATYGFPIQDGPCQDVGNDKQNPTYKCGPTEFTEDMVHFYPHDAEFSGCITAGAFVPSYAGWPESFQGAYLYGDYKRAGIYRIIPGKDERCLECDPPVSDYSSSEQVLSTTKRPVSMKFGPYKGGYALYYVKFIKNINRDGAPGLFRIAFTGKVNRPPQAYIQVDKNIGFSPLSVQFDGTGSVDPDGDSLTYSWDFDDGNSVADSKAPITSYEYDTPGTYFVTMKVSDSSGATSEATIQIDVDDNNPIPDIESPAYGTVFSLGDT